MNKAGQSVQYILQYGNEEPRHVMSMPVRLSSWCFIVELDGFEPSTTRFSVWHSTSELQLQVYTGDSNPW